MLNCFDVDWYENVVGNWYLHIHAFKSYLSLLNDLINQISSENP